MGAGASPRPGPPCASRSRPGARARLFTPRWPRCRASARFCALFFACACLSISLCCICARSATTRWWSAGGRDRLRARVSDRRTLGTRYTPPQRAAVLLFNTFFAAFFSLLAVLALSAGMARARCSAAGGGRRGAAAGLLRDVPGRGRSRSSRSGPAACSNLGIVGAHLLRREFCGALLPRGRWPRREPGARGGAGPARAAARLPLAAGGGYALIGCASRFPGALLRGAEPILTLVFLLDAFSLVAAVCRAAPARRLAGRAAVAAVIALVVPLPAPRVAGESTLTRRCVADRPS
jgi:hypothetical protein